MVCRKVFFWLSGIESQLFSKPLLPLNEYTMKGGPATRLGPFGAVVEDWARRSSCRVKRSLAPQSVKTSRHSGLVHSQAPY